MQTVEILTIRLIYEPDPSRCRGFVQLYDAATGHQLWEDEIPSEQLLEVAHRADDDLWAYVAGGLIGLEAFSASRAERLLPEGP